MLMNNRERMSAELREAIASHQLFLMYQPLVEIDISCILGLEALVQLTSSFGRHHGAR
jgi:sensor c-di-GMP phosphodiesterase-like protein